MCHIATDMVSETSSQVSWDDFSDSQCDILAVTLCRCDTCMCHATLWCVAVDMMLETGSQVSWDDFSDGQCDMYSCHTLSLWHLHVSRHSVMCCCRHDVGDR